MSTPAPLVQAIGSDRDYLLTLYDPTGDVVGTFLGTDTLSAVIWPGDDLASVATPTATWIEASLGTIKLTIAKADIATLTAQPYPIRVSITRGARTWEAWSGWLDLQPASASGTAYPTYGTFREMLDVAGPWLKDLMFESSQAGFARERGLARSTLDRRILARVRIERRGWVSGSSLVGSYADGDNPTVKGYLDDGFLVINKTVTEIVSRLAVAYVCLGDLGRAGKENPYEVAGLKHAAIARKLMSSYVAEFDTDGDGDVDFTVNCGVINMRNAY